MLFSAIQTLLWHVSCCGCLQSSGANTETQHPNVNVTPRTLPTSYVWERWRTRCSGRYVDTFFWQSCFRQLGWASNRAKNHLKPAFKLCCQFRGNLLELLPFPINFSRRKANQQKPLWKHTWWKAALLSPAQTFNMQTFSSVMCGLLLYFV